ISKIPQTDYQPRVADDRIGYFMTVVKDYSNSADEEQFVRYINRWNLKRADKSSSQSVPKEPIIFWIEKTVPFKYRKPIYDGIAEWNKAFAKAGFLNAIEVRQQPDDASWDPEDINYNTFRWITSDAGMAMGPSRVNPYTGQILDADIIFDADFLDSWNSQFDTFGPDKIAALTGGPLDLESYRDLARRSGPSVLPYGASCALSQGMSLHFAFGRAALAAEASDAGKIAELREKLILQGLKEVTMHEVGHTLGLRHNFKASTFLSLEEMNDVEKTSRTGLAASVMDYLPPNIVPSDMVQGDYYSTTIGPYDEWAIEYGYRDISGDTVSEQPRLLEIAARSGEPGLAFATDENTRGIDPDPFSNRFDLGKDPIAYATRRAKIVKELMPKVAEKLVDEGEGYAAARQAFNVLLAEQGRAMFFAARYIGGLDVSRSHKGDKDAPPPFRVVEAEKQRAALELLSEQVFSDRPYEVDPQLYSFLAPSHWSHWGKATTYRPDFPVHQVIESWQMRILDQLLSSLTLERLHDSELKLSADVDAFTTAELLEKLTDSVFAEFKSLPEREFSNRQPAVSSLRRNLQRNYIGLLANIALSRTGAPQDCQAIAYDQLDQLAKRLDEAQQRAGLDSYTRAHLLASSQRIRKALDASMTLYSP
ncbi:MAG: zinc-dependent metalloprotease, partial [Planctomycetales bacterium]|nr:zinc-dependent metalloprotease [Planctomycetales bacterium]